MGKAKPTKHTSAELAAKAYNATINRGGGQGGLADRLGGQAGHSKFKCSICSMQAPSTKSMQIHHESKHPKIPWDVNSVINTHELSGGVTTAGVAVRGGLGKKK